MRFFLLLFLSFPAYATVWHGHADLNVPLDAHPIIRKIDFSLSVINGQITDWFVDDHMILGEQTQLSKNGICPDPDIPCHRAEFVTPDHIQIWRSASPYRTSLMDLFLAGPLEENVPYTADIYSFYSQHVFHGEGVLTAPEPTAVIALGMLLAHLVIVRPLWNRWARSRAYSQSTGAH